MIAAVYPHPLIHWMPYGAAEPTHWGRSDTVTMITKEQAPVEWAALMYELDDAREHIETMMARMNSDPEYDEEVFRVDMAHVFSHLNRAWHSRNLIGELQGQEWHEASKFPGDLDPI